MGEKSEAADFGLHNVQGEIFCALTLFILALLYIFFYMHATLITTKIVQHYPHGCHNHTCALEGTWKNSKCHSFFSVTDESGRLAVAPTSYVCTKWSSF